MYATRSTLWKAWLVLLVGPLTACRIGVTETQPGKNADVDIRSPFGQLAVRGDVDARDTGLPTYPGAVPARSRDSHDSANVNIDTAWFGVQVVAATFESGDAPRSVLDFYRKEMTSYGGVTECRGEVKFRGRSGAKRAVCDEKGPLFREVQLVAGTEERQKIVVVKPSGTGSKFSLVYVETRKDN